MTEKRKGIRGGITVALAVLRVWFLALYRGGIYPFGDKSILCIDLYGQYTHFLGFLKNSSPSEFLYSFTKGFGGNTLGLFAYYCISVFNLFVFFFDSMEATAFAIITAKLVFRGLCMYVYMRKTSKSIAVSVGAAVAYGVYPYFIFYYCNIIWFDCFALLPILVLGTEYVADGKKVAPQKFMTWFTAVPLEEGENIVEMTYIPRGFVLGLCLMAVGALLLIAGVLLKDKVFNKEGRLC